MDIVINPNESSGVTGVICIGRFDAHEVDTARAAFADINAGGVFDIDVLLSGVPFIDSAGLAELVRAMKHCREGGGDLRIVAPSDPVRIILELTGLVKAFVVSSGP